MARKVFFSFHYQRDVFRVSQVRNSWVTQSHGDAQPFVDKADWEQVKRSEGIEAWIERQLKGTSVTVVLIGAETAQRDWVMHEIKRSYLQGKGLLGIYLNNVKDPKTGTDAKGANPFASLSVTHDGKDIPLSRLVNTYDWVNDDGYNNLSRWVEQAAADAGR